MQYFKVCQEAASLAHLTPLIDAHRTALSMSLLRRLISLQLACIEDSLFEIWMARILKLQEIETNRS